MTPPSFPADLFDSLPRSAPPHRVNSTPTTLLRHISLAGRQPSSYFSKTPPMVPKWFCCNAVLRFGTIQVRSHFPAAPGESTDRDPAATALREAAEEIGLDPSSVDPLVTLPRLHIVVSDFDVTAVVAHWRQPGPVYPVNPAETHQVLTVALPDLDNPDRWHQYQCNDWSGPATFLDGGARLWGYTAEILLYMSKNR